MDVELYVYDLSKVEFMLYSYLKKKSLLTILTGSRPNGMFRQKD